MSCSHTQHTHSFKVELVIASCACSTSALLEMYTNNVFLKRKEDTLTV